MQKAKASLHAADVINIMVHVAVIKHRADKNIFLAELFRQHADDVPALFCVRFDITAARMRDINKWFVVHNFTPHINNNFQVLEHYPASATGAPDDLVSSGLLPIGLRYRPPE